MRSGPKPRFRSLQWLFPLAVTIHNLEEAIWLPRWSALHPAYVPWQISPLAFRIGVVLLTAAAFFITAKSVRAIGKRVWTYLLLAYVAAMFLNVFVPHLLGSLYLRAYTPGVVSAVVVVLPVTALLLIRAVRERTIATPLIATLVFGIPVAIAAAVSMLFIARLPL